MYRAALYILILSAMVGVRSARAGLADSGFWTLAPPPTARSNAFCTFDPIGGRLYLLGGSSDTSNGPLRDLWGINVNDSPNWFPLAVTQALPDGFWIHAAAFDPIGQKVFVLGGQDTAPGGVEIYALSIGSPGSPWVEVSAGGEPPPQDLFHYATCWDSSRNHLLVSGGRTFAGYVTDTWVLTLGSEPSWSRIPVTGSAPPPRRLHTAIYDSVNDQLVVFGGQVLPTDRFADTWALNLNGTNEWREIVATGQPPLGRIFHASAFAPHSSAMVIFGGSSFFSEPLGDLWSLVLDGNPRWQQVNQGLPAPGLRSGSSLVFDDSAQRLLMFGGVLRDSINTFCQDLWSLNPEEPAPWTLLVSPPAPSPNARLGASMVHDPLRDRMILLGGSPALRSGGDVWTLSLSGTMAWDSLHVEGDPPASYESKAVFDLPHDRLLVFCTDNGQRSTFGIWELTLGSIPTWSQLNVPGPSPPDRLLATIVFDSVRERVVLYGGIGAGTVLTDTWALSLDAPLAWTELAVSDTAHRPAWELPLALHDSQSDRLLVFGGSGNGYSNDVWEFPLGTATSWRRLSPGGTEPTGRRSFAGFLDRDRNRMVFFGGETYSPTFSLGDTWSLNLEGDGFWLPLTGSGQQPAPRHAHAGAYDVERDRFIMFGGRNLTSSTDVILDDTWMVLFSPSEDATAIEPTSLAVNWSRWDAILTWTARESGGSGVFRVYRSDQELGDRIEISNTPITGMGPLRFIDSHPPVNGADYWLLETERSGVLSWHGPIRLGSRPLESATLRASRLPNGAVAIHYGLAVAGEFSLEVFDVMGRRVRLLDSGRAPEGEHQAIWDGSDERGRDVAKGVYWVRFSTLGEANTLRLDSEW
jgi:hypothetical protein